ncbi:3121_t:CDS:2, partial [Cetraspora pellucida]
QLSQEEYWEEIVKISIEVMTNLCNEVNTELEKNNRMPYLNMAYEEVLFSVVFTGKKKYYSLEHKNKPNFNPDKKIINRTLKVDYDEFIQICIWRPKKEGKQENISVKWFVSQIEAKYSCKVLKNQQLIKKGLLANEYLYKVPKPDKQFSYIVVVPEEINDNCRKKYHNKKKTVWNTQMCLFGLCAHFINYNDKYQPSPESFSKVLDHKKKSKKKKLQIAKNLLQSDDSLSLDEDEIAKIKDEELQ